MDTASNGDALRDAHAKIRAEAVALAGAPGDIPQRATALHQLYLDSGGNHVFPQVALHGALWAFGFFSSTGGVGRMITYRYFYNREEWAKRTKMLAGFSDGFLEANRSVFIDTYTNYHFTKEFGEESGASALIGDELLAGLNSMHEARRSNRPFDRIQRGEMFELALKWEQEVTVGPKVKAEVERFDCPILTTLVLKPVVHFAYFPSRTFFWFRNFADTAERIRRAVRSYELAEQVGWPRVIETMKEYRVLPRPVDGRVPERAPVHPGES
jgi:hypothetical protein